MACAVNADQINAVIQTTINGSQVPDGAAGIGERRIQRSYSQETKLEVVSFHRENGENWSPCFLVNNYGDHSQPPPTQKLHALASPSLRRIAGPALLISHMRNVHVSL